jgi:hypothetical protein
MSRKLISRKLINVLMISGALACVVVGSTIAWSNIAPTPGSQADVEKAKFDQAPVQAPIVAPATVRPEQAPAVMTKADFDQAFSDVATPRRDNTPANREKLRAAGWKRITVVGSR